jgi:type II secretory pathway pseudopilin PulG
VALAVVLILISATVRLGSYVKTRSSIQLAQSALGVLETALQMYYETSPHFRSERTLQTQRKRTFG